MIRPLKWGVVGACAIIIFKDICDNDGSYFFINSPVLTKNKENEYLIKITNMVNSFKVNMLRPNEFW